MEDLAPICLFTYNRKQETIRTIEALKNNFLANKSELFIFSDGYKNNNDKKSVLELRNYLKTISGFKSIEIIESNQNKGLANSIIYGVNTIIQKYDKVIVLEDDLVTTRNFLDFMNQSLNYYFDDDRIQSINGYSLKINCESGVYFHQRTFPWGWATWNDRWSEDIFNYQSIEELIKSDPQLLRKFNKKCGVDMARMLKNAISGTINSWYIRWALNHFINKNYAVFPSSSFIVNIGFDLQGTHCKGINTYVNDLDSGEKREFNLVPFYKLKKSSNKKLLKYFKRTYKLLFRFNLLKTQVGREKIKQEIKNRIFNK
ncbi:glycosyltransferase [Seonamhaeicola aphaedonensis]|uniref:Glycosyl transferase family 2 n=1 Tax=Seonamhaeicola aphaedonensis TaxID=1461338 RepID=A0A3D9HHM1_9FLAO|nr:glycosyltransferase [Seonamhaeicola aphaedonensis]RED48934.1 glycosyl transferase family 2 [Seonamhaeicola aphaedonensis]